MVSVKDTNLYAEVIKEFNYSFGNIFIFKDYVVTEFNEGIVVSWEEHGKIFTKDVSDFLGSNGEGIILVSNRINSYSAMASDWLKFFRNNYTLKGYLIVSDEKTMILSAMIENLFFKNKIKRFNSLYVAINYIKKGLIEIT